MRFQLFHGFPSKTKTAMINRVLLFDIRFPLFLKEMCIFGISTDELLGLEAPEVLSLSGLTGAQKKTLIKLRNELLSPSQKGNDLSPQQMEILHDIIKAFG